MDKPKKKEPVFTKYLDTKEMTKGSLVWNEGYNQACDEWEKYIKQTYLKEEEIAEIVREICMRNPYQIVDKLDYDYIAKALYKAQENKR